MTKSDHTHDKTGAACNHVMRKKRPMMLIAHDRDGVWQFMCGKDDHTKAKQAKKVCSICMFETMVTGITADEIPPGHIAERKSKTVWEVRELTDEEVAHIDEPDATPAWRTGLK